jgi:transposase-like protein
MSKVTRERHSADFKAWVALEAIRGEHTLAEFGARHGVHLTLVAAWKKAAIAWPRRSRRRQRRRRARARPRSTVCTARLANWWWNEIFWRRHPGVERVLEA